MFRVGSIGVLAGSIFLSVQVVTVADHDRAVPDGLGAVTLAAQPISTVKQGALSDCGREVSALAEPLRAEREVAAANGTPDCPAPEVTPGATPRANGEILAEPYSAVVAIVDEEDAAELTPTPTVTATPTPTPTVTATPTPTPAARARPTTTATTGAPKSFTYTVVQGDTVSALAARFGVSVRTITRANGMTEEDLLVVGRELQILRVSGTLHTVAEGESLSALAERYSVIPEEIAAANGLEEPYVIRPGERLLIPQSQDPRSTDPDVPPARPDPKRQGEQAYEAIGGDTLARIAARFGVPLEALVAANGLDVARPLAIGQRLTIPPVGAVAHVVQKGETVVSIAALYGASAVDVIKANELAEPYVLSIGQRLLVPGGTIQRPPPAVTSTPTPAPRTPRPIPTIRQSGRVSAPNVYEVVAGDTLTRIATRFGVSREALVAVNGLDIAKPLAIGQRLTIPTGDQAAAKIPPTATPTPRPQPTPTRTPQPQPTPTPTPAPDLGARVVGIATKYLGARYTWGGASPETGFDCSGFVMYVFRQAGVLLPRDLWGQLNSGSKVDRAALQPGDVVFFQNTYMPGLSHNGIYIGDGQFIHAAGENAGVIISRLDSTYWTTRYLGASRPGTA